ncbi:MAG: NADH:flavin oxidoreductase [Eubacterium sp.]|nr:NADH:flavin oxidoreductase [Eubacterium sp.]
MIFESTVLSGISVKNRIIRSATHDGLADESGKPTQKLINKYVYLAKNNVGCIITGYIGVSENGMSPYPAMLKLHKDGMIDAYKALTDAVHAYDTPIIAQLAHCGRQTSSKSIGAQKVAPTAMRHLFYPDKAKELDENEIYQIIDDFVLSAVRAKQAGFDGVQLHAGHGYLLHDFLSPYGNRRNDGWGGSIENRCKIVKLIIKGIKEKTDNMPVWIKLSATDNRKNGMNINDSIEIVKYLESAGLDCVEVSCGSVEDGMNTMRSRVMPMDAVFKYREPCASFPSKLKSISLSAAKLVNPLIKQPTPLENFNVINASKIKKNVSIPVIAVGGIHKLNDMEHIVDSNMADFVSMCRPFICEPNLVTKLMKGTQKQAKCIMCNYCGLVIEKESTKCLYGEVNL